MASLDGITEQLSSKLWAVNGVEAIVLSGAHAKGNTTDDSALDLALLYRDANGIDAEKVRDIASEINDTLDSIVVEVGGWGPWINGGAKLVVDGQPVDVHYRSIDAYERVIEQAQIGVAEHDWLQRPPYGFPSVAYLGEIEMCKILLDPRDVVSDLRELVRPYPEALKTNLINGFLWGAEHTIESARLPAARNDAYAAMGGITRAVAMITFAVFALNEHYYTDDRGALDLTSSFAVAPKHFTSRMHDALRDPHLGGAVEQLGRIIDETKTLWNQSKA